MENTIDEMLSLVKPVRFAQKVCAIGYSLRMWEVVSNDSMNSVEWGRYSKNDVKEYYEEVYLRNKAKENIWSYLKFLISKSKGGCDFLSKGYLDLNDSL